MPADDLAPVGAGTSASTLVAKALNGLCIIYLQIHLPRLYSHVNPYEVIHEFCYYLYVVQIKPNGFQSCWFIYAH